MHFSVFGFHLNIHVPDASRALEFSEFKIVAEQTLGLAHNGPDDVLSLDGPVHLNISPNFIFHGLAFVSAGAV